MLKQKKHCGKIFILTAPSGCGKTSVVERAVILLKKNLLIERLVTYTTRSPRNNEHDGIDYYFISKEKFLLLEKEGFFLETTIYNDNYYGSPATIQKNTNLGLSTIIITDIPGVIRLKSLIPEAITIWLSVPNTYILYKRLIARNTENKLQIKKRITIAKKEIKIAKKIDSLFNYKLFNISRQKTIKNLMRIMLKELV